MLQLHKYSVKYPKENKEIKEKQQQETQTNKQTNRKTEIKNITITTTNT